MGSIPPSGSQITTKEARAETIAPIHIIPVRPANYPAQKEISRMMTPQSGPDHRMALNVNSQLVLCEDTITDPMTKANHGYKASPRQADCVQPHIQPRVADN